MSLISTSQINALQLQQAVQLYASGASFSGNFLAYVNASGYLGNTVVYASGGAQVIAGAKTFTTAPVVPYGGTTGQTIPRLYVDNQDAALSGVLTGQFAAPITALSGFVIGASGNLSSFRITGSSNIPIANLTGIGGTQISIIGGIVYISGAAGGGAGSSTVQVTGSSAIASPNFTGVGQVTVSYDGTYIRVSGAVDTTLSGYVENTFVHRTPVDEQIFGIKTFTGNPQIAAATLASGAVNLTQLLAASGALTGSIGGGGVTNNYFITGTGTINNTFNTSGNISNTFNDYTTQQNNYTVTGNYNIASFFFDPVITGLNIAESFVGGMGYVFTGAAFSCRTSGNGPVNGGVLSGRLYQVDLNNTEQTLYNFTFTSGIVYSGSPGFSIYVTGRNRVGVSITNSMSGIQKFCVGIFGGTYV